MEECSSWAPSFYSLVKVESVLDSDFTCASLPRESQCNVYNCCVKSKQDSLNDLNSVQFSCSVVSDSLWPQESQHVRPPCPSPTPRVYSNSCPLSSWCHPAISSSVFPFSSCSQSLLASGSFPVSQLFAWGGQRAYQKAWYYYISSVQSLSHVQLCSPMNLSMPGLPVHHQLPESTQTHVHGLLMPSNHLILCCPLLLLPSIFPSLRVFSNEPALRIRWPQCWSFSFKSVVPMNTQDWSPLGWTGWISLQSKELSRVFNTTVQKHQFFGSQLSL